MRPGSPDRTTIDDFARRIEDAEPRSCFLRFCEAMVRFPAVSLEAAPFELRFSAPGGFFVRVSPYNELFLAAVGDAPPCELRIAGRDGLAAALELAMRHFLDTAGAAPAPSDHAV